MMQKSEQHRPYGRQTCIYNWREERADVKNERIQKPLPSQVFHHLCTYDVSFSFHDIVSFSTIIITIRHTNHRLELFMVIHLDQKFVNFHVRVLLFVDDGINERFLYNCSTSTLCLSRSST